LAGQDLPSYDPDSQAAASGAPASPSAMAEEFARLRVASLAALSALTGADLERRSRHEALGPVTLSDLVHEWAAHDLVHTIQAERALMQPFIPGTGPWRSFFAEHEIAAEAGDQG